MARGVVRYNPFSELKALQRSFFGEDFTSAMRGAVVPTTDVYTEGDQRMVVEAHLPNFALDDIDISIDEGALVIRAEKRERSEDTDKRYLVRESSMSFYRRIALPDRADEQGISADFREGVLKVTVPFVEAPLPRRVPISTDSGGQAAGQVGAASSGQSADSAGGGEQNADSAGGAERGGGPGTDPASEPIAEQGDTAPLGEVGFGTAPAPEAAPRTEE